MEDRVKRSKEINSNVLFKATNIQYSLVPGYTFFERNINRNSTINIFGI